MTTNMTTKTYRDAAVLSEQDAAYDRHVREVIGHDAAWLALAAREPERMANWLTSTIQQVQAQITYRKSRAKTRKDQKEFHEWRGRAVWFLKICERRKRDLSEIVERETSARHRQKMSDRVTEARNITFTLAAAVLAHQNGTMSDAELHAHLDDLTMPDGSNGGTATLRTVTVRRAEHEARQTARAATPTGAPA